jgi:uncharacterized protein YbaP (TraB family)
MVMKKRFFVLLAVSFFLCIHALAQSSVWRVSKGGNSIYLGGSVHVLRATDFPMPKEFDTAFDQSDILVFESNLEEMANPDFMQKMLPRIMLPAGKTLQTELSPPVYERLTAKCAELGVPMEMVSQFTPFMAIVTLTTLQLQNLGFVSQGVDLHYLSRAKEHAKKRLFLESAEYQMSLFEGESAYQDEFVLQSLEDLEQNRLKTLMPLIIDEWKKGKTAQTNRMIAEMNAKFPRFYKRVFSDRNHTWLHQIERYLDTGETEFMIVGLGHLLGDDGLLRSLQDKGYRVEQVR